MEFLDNSSIKLKKKARNTKLGDRNYLCGGCQRAYKSYPALYLHIKRKHNGIRPINTRTSKPVAPVSKEKIHTGRPQKPSHDVDGIPEEQVALENTQSELLGFLGERLKVVSVMDAKPKLENIVTSTINSTSDISDEAMIQIRKEIERLYAELKNRGTETFDIELDFDSFQNISPDNGLKILTWFLLWMGKYIVKPEFLRELAFLISRIWKVLSEKQLQVQDLDNKLVWNNVMKECEGYMDKLTSFERKKDLVMEFINKTCHLIGRIFES